MDLFGPSYKTWEEYSNDWRKNPRRAFLATLRWILVLIVIALIGRAISASQSSGVATSGTSSVAVGSVEADHSAVAIGPGANAQLTEVTKNYNLMSADDISYHVLSESKFDERNSQYLTPVISVQIIKDPKTERWITWNRSKIDCATTSPPTLTAPGGRGGGFHEGCITFNIGLAAIDSCTEYFMCVSLAPIVDGSSDLFKLSTTSKEWRQTP
jgi:hypothetical protein